MRSSLCSCQKGLLLAVISAVTLNLEFIPPWSGYLTGQSPWGEKSTAILNSSMFARNLDNDVTEGDDEDALTLPNDNNTYYDQVFVWNVPPNETNFNNNMYRQWCRWRNRKKSKPSSRTMDLLKIDNYSVPQMDKPLLSLIHMKLHCGNTMRESSMGTGNFVQMMYLIRLASAGTFPKNGLTRDVFDVQFTCIDDDIIEASKSLVLPWLTGRFSSQNTRNFLDVYWNHSKEKKVIDYSCKEDGWGRTPVGGMVPFIRHDLRWMAIKLVGLPQEDKTHPAYAWLQRQQRTSEQYAKNHTETVTAARITNSMHHNVPIHPQELAGSLMIPNVELDETAIHFRCGDVMTSSHSQFRFLKYKEYAQHIDNSTKSIGIITQSFGDANTNATEGTQVRREDLDDPYRVALCQEVVEGFATYLKERFPIARVQIRNGPSEPVALAFARLIMARHSFASADSSFAVFPALASFGVGYHIYPTPRKASKGMKNKFLIDIFPHLEKNDAKLNYTDGTMVFLYIPIDDALYADQTLAMRRENETQAYNDIVRWFRDDTFVAMNTAKQI